MPDFTCPRCGGHVFSGLDIDEHCKPQRKRCDNDTNGQPLDTSLRATAERLKNGESEPVGCGWDSGKDER